MTRFLSQRLFLSWSLWSLLAGLLVAFPSRAPKLEATRKTHVVPPTHLAPFASPQWMSVSQHRACCSPWPCESAKVGQSPGEPPMVSATAS